jgi:formylglycine-generating enzyme required for sulfatase activity
MCTFEKKIKYIMNRIILIGNGFDLAHGLKTSYKDFINDLCEQIESNRNTPNEPNLWSSVFGENISENEKFEDLIINEDKVQNKFLSALKKELNIQNWVDVEKVYYKQLINCMGNENKPKKTNYSINDLNRDFGFIEKKLEEYLLKQVSGTTVKTISSVETYLEKNNSNDTYNKTYIVNFNYTATDTKYKDKIDKEDEIIRLHGELRNPENPMIFGYGDELAKNYDEIQELDDNRYLEYVKSIKYSLTDNYNILWNAIKEGEYHIYIFGLSCGNSDRTLLHELFEDENCKKIKIFYWEKNDMSDDYLEIYKNISRIFRDKGRLRTVVATKPKSKALVPIENIQTFLDENFELLNNNGHKFYISKFLVTQAQYESFMGNNPSYFKGEKLPVETVSWYDAAEFCNRLSDKFKKDKRYIEKNGVLEEDISKNGFRLPTSEEWIFAAQHCRKDGTETTEYAGTNNKNELKNYAWYYENSGDKVLDEKKWSIDNLNKNNCRTHEVGTAKNSNELKIHDMSGNVWEWCEDSDGSDRVLRGGSWRDYSGGTRVSYRGSSIPDYRYADSGFRLALSSN